MTNLRLVAIDLSVAATGIAWTHNHRGKLELGCRTIHTRRTVQDGIDNDRNHQVMLGIASVLQSRPHLVTIEWLPAVTKVNPETGKVMSKGEATLRGAELQGILTFDLWRAKIPYVYVKPTYVQMWATGSGRSGKKLVKQNIIADYGRFLTTQIEDDNAADATSLLTMTLAAYGLALDKNLPQSQRRALDMCGVKWPDVAPLPTLDGLR